MNYSFQQHKTRKYLRMSRSTSEEEIVSVTNRNNLSVEKHLKMLNLNDTDYEYLECIGDINV